jgi:flagellar biogenesis protein FliO
MITAPGTPKTGPRRIAPKLVGAGVLVVVVGFGLPRLLGAGTGATAADAAPASSIALGPALARVAGCMVLVCGLCVLVTRLMSRRSDTVVGPMHSVASLRLQGRCVVHLVQAGERRLLVGTDAGGVKALLELPALPPAEADILPMTAPPTSRAA